MSNNKIIPCHECEEICKKIEQNLDTYMRLMNWDMVKADIWAFWRTLCSFIVLANDKAILERMYDSSMSNFNKGQVTKAEFISYMTRSTI